MLKVYTKAEKSIIFYRSLFRLAVKVVRDSSIFCYSADKVFFYCLVCLFFLAPSYNQRGLPCLNNVCCERLFSASFRG